MNLCSISVNRINFKFFWVLVNIMTYLLDYLSLFIVTVYLSEMNAHHPSSDSLKEEPETFRSSILVLVFFQTFFLVKCHLPCACKDKQSAVSWHLPTHCSLFVFFLFGQFKVTTYEEGKKAFFFVVQKKIQCQQNETQRNSFL